jgi:hypothetical protein
VSQVFVVLPVISVTIFKIFSPKNGEPVGNFDSKYPGKTIYAET